MDESFRLATRNGRIMAEFPDAVPAVAGRPFIVPVFLPLAGCPNRCVYCDQHTITGTHQSHPDPLVLAQGVRRFLAHRGSRRGPTQVAFYGGTFLNLPASRIRQLLDMANGFVQQGAAAGLRFSTRPDSVRPETLAQLADYPVQTVELGVQSMDDNVLAQARRGHDAQATRTAVARLRKAGYEIGLQMMIGLPGDTAQGALATAQAIVALQPDFVRIYPTLVLPGSALADDFRAGRYRPLSLDASVALTCRLLQLFTARGIRVARMGLPAEIRPVDARSWLAGPHHPAFGELVYSRLYLALAAAAIASAPRRGNRARLRIHPKRVSALTGQNRCNIIQLQQRFDLRRIDIATEAHLPLNRLEVDMLPAL